MNEVPPPNQDPGGAAAGDATDVSFSPPTPEAIEALLPGYSVSQLIAQGGMGAVYRGIQVRLERPVGIKVLPRHYGADLDFAARFDSEAKAMARLSHNNIVSVYDYGETDTGDLLYIIMEFVDGTDLHQLLHQEGITIDQKINLLIQVCDALQYAHGIGIVHRDIKPANILIDHASNVKVADFGLARFGQTSASDSTEQIELGTPDYSAPEVFYEGVVADHRVDIYALGVLTCEVLTGQIPARGGGLPSTIHGVDRRFDALVTQAMAEEPAQRFQNVEEMRRAILDIRNSPHVVAGGAIKVPARSSRPRTVAAVRGASRRSRRPVPKPKTGGSPGVFVFLFLLITAAIVATLWWFENRPPPVVDSNDDGRLLFEPETDSGPPSVEDSPKAGTPSSPRVMTSASAPTGKGRLRAQGMLPRGIEIDVDNASAYSDFVKVGALKNGWFGLRENGELINYAGTGNSGMTGIQTFVTNTLWITFVKKDGTLWSGIDRPWFADEISNAVKAVAGSNHRAVLLDDGTLKVWGNRYGGDRLANPPVPLSGIIDIAASQSVLAAADSSGRVHCWGKNLEVNSRVIGDGVVAVEGSIFRMVALTRSGQVYEWSKNDPNSARSPDLDLGGPIIAIRANGDTAAAQREDGSWVAWGKNAGNVIETINQLGPTPDIAFFTEPGKSDVGFVVWIEPDGPDS